MRHAIGGYWGGLAAGALALALPAFLIAPVFAQNGGGTQRLSFQISTGSTTGTYFPVGELLAEVLSHPPGVGRCESAFACGPAGLIVSTRASEGSIANLEAVNTGAIGSGLAQADVVAMAVAGQGPFRRAGPAKNLRVIADLFGEDMHLIAAKNAKIARVADLRGKRVSLASEGSGTIVTARAVLAAYGLSDRSVIANYDTAERAAGLLQAGKLDAMFLVGGAPVNLLEPLLDSGDTVLVPIDGPGRARLLARAPYYAAHAIAQGTYGRVAAVETVMVDALWIADAEQPEPLIYGMLKAIYNPANRARFEAERVGAHFIEAAAGVKSLPAPLHAGAQRFFTESGIVKAPPLAAAPRARKT